MDFSEILKYLGDFGKFQKLIFILASIIQFFVGIHMLANVFLMGEPKHRCLIPKCDTAASQYYEYYVEFAIPNVTDDYGQLIPSLCDYYKRIEDGDFCKETAFNRSSVISCDSYIWSKSEFELTAISEFNIVCSKSWDGAFSNSFFMVGILVGSAGFGIISDKYGRKTVIMLASITLLLSSTTTAFSINFEMFSCLRFITAAAICGLIQAGYVLALEFIGTSKRLVCASLVQVVFSVGELILGVLAYHIRNWKILELAISLPCIILVLYYWLLPESVRWLISKGKQDKARKVILTAAKWNKVIIPERLLMGNNLVTDDLRMRTVGPWDLMKTPHLRKWSLNVFLNWTVNSMVYFGLALSSGNLHGDIYMNFSLLALVEIVSILVTTVALVRFGSRRVLCSVMVLTGLACGATICTPNDLMWASLLLAVVGRSGVCASFTIIYVYSAEIFPTVLRSTGIGLSSTFGRIGGIIAPIITQLGKVHHFLPMLIFSIATIFSGLLTLALPETHNKQLPDTIEEAENFGLSKESQYTSSSAHGSLSISKPTIQNYSIDEQKGLLEEE